MLYFTQVYLVFGVCILWHILSTTDDGEVKNSFTANMKNVEVYNTTSWTCTLPVSQIMYLKMGEMGSTTLTNTLYKYALRKQLRVMLFNQIPLLWETMEQIRFKMPGEGGKSDEKFDIFAEHVIYNPKTVKKKYMHMHTVVMSSIVNPLDQCQSEQTSENTMARHIRNRHGCGIHMEVADQLICLHDSRIDTIDHNFGIPSQANSSRKSLHINGNQFHLVTVSGYMDESLVLLRRKLCWSVEDVIYIVLESIDSRQQVKFATDPKTHNEINPSDFYLYHYFLRKLLKTLAVQSEEFWSELYAFRIIIKRAKIFCRKLYHLIIKINGHLNPNLILNPTNEDVLSVAESEWGPSFVITPTDCILMNIKLPVFRNILKIKQYPQLCKIRKNDKPEHQSIDVTKDIVILNDTVMPFNIQYCSQTMDPVYGIPLDILTNKDILVLRPPV